MSNYVFLIDSNKTPMNPIHPSQARKLRDLGKAAVFRRFPFTLILKRTIDNPVVHSLTLKIDPGSKITGLALATDRNEVIWAMELQHCGQAHWIDAACVGVVETIKLVTTKILKVKATGFGGRQRCQTDKFGYPQKYRPLRPILGFCTGDIVRADVPKGKYAGTFTARVCPMSHGYGEFVIDKKRRSIKLDYLTPVHRKEGYDYA